MRRMDPSFARELSSSNPEGYEKALRSSQRDTQIGSPSDIHVAMIPAPLTRFTAGVVVMLFLIAGFFLISESTNARAFGIPSGPVVTGMSHEIDMSRSLSGRIGSLGQSPENLEARINPIGGFGESFAKSWDR